MEFPLSTYKFAGYPLVFSGGGFFRALPYSAIKRMTRKSDYVMGYFHPRDFDSGQPKPPGLPAMRHITSYIGLSQAMHKLEKWTGDFPFTDLETAIGKIDWNTTPNIDASKI